MYQKIILAGGTGFLGQILVRHFKNSTRELVILTREARFDDSGVQHVIWDGKTPGAWCQELEGADLVVNLCGKSVDCRYTEENKAEIFRSRLEPTRAIGQAIAACAAPPRRWINLASATIYRHAEDRPQDETSGEQGSGFSEDVCRAWEKAFFSCETPGTAKAALRTSFVLGNSGSAFPKLRKLARYGLGGHQGNGRQFVSWIHEQDFARIIDWLMEHPEQQGALNVTAPGPVTNRHFMATLRKQLKISIGIPAPAWLLKIAARIMSTEPELILKSRWVLPTRLQDAGFVFRFPSLEAALSQLVG
jgi:uncharacterized protein (TIGR01777 family)